MDTNLFPDDILDRENAIVTDYGTEIIQHPFVLFPLAGLPSLYCETIDMEIEKCGKCKRNRDGIKQPMFALTQNKLEEEIVPATLVLVWETYENTMSDASRMVFNMVYRMLNGVVPPILVTYAVRCPGEKAPTAKLLEQCADKYLRSILLDANIVDPKALIVAVGSGAWKALHSIATDNPAPGSISDIHGLPIQLDFVGQNLSGEDTSQAFTILPVLHPSYVMKNMRRADDLLNDFQKMGEVMEVGWDNNEINELLADIDKNAIMLKTMPSIGELDAIAEGMLQESNGVVVMDVEGRNTTLPSCGNYLTLTGFGASSKIAIQLADDAITATTYLLHKIRDKGGILVGQNIYYDFMMLYKQRIINSVDDLPTHRDTMIMQQLVNENEPAGLKTMVQRYFNIPNWSPSMPSGTDFGKISLDQLGPYHARDLCLNHLLYGELVDMLALEEVSGSWKIDYVDFMHKIDRILLAASISGMKVDVDYIGQLEQTYKTKLEELQDWFRQPLFQRVIASLRNMDTAMKKTIAQTLCTFPLEETYDLEKDLFNPGSAQQVGAVLAVALEPEVKQLLFKVIGKSLRTNSGAVSLNEANLAAIKVHLSKTAEMQHKFQFIIDMIENVLKYREADKLFGTYITGMTKQLWPDNCVRAHWKVRGTVTGRLACSDPNL